MDNLDIFKNHILHPFSFQINHIEFELSNKEKRIAVIGAVAGLILAGIGAPIAFYCISAYFKFKHMEEKQLSPVQTKVDNFVNTLKPLHVNPPLPKPPETKTIKKAEVPLLPNHHIPKIPPVELEEGNPLEWKLEEIKVDEEDEDSPEPLPEKDKAPLKWEHEKIDANEEGEDNPELLPKKDPTPLKPEPKVESLVKKDDVIEVLPDDFNDAPLLSESNDEYAIPHKTLRASSEEMPTSFDYAGYEEWPLDLVSSKVPVYGQNNFKHLLQEFFTLHETPSDGNCCAYALAKAENSILLDVNDSDQNDAMLRDYGNAVRAKIADFMQNNREVFCNYVDRIHPLTSALENAFDRYNLIFRGQSNPLMTFEEFARTQIEELLNQGKYEIAEQLRTELDFKPKEKSWAEYFQRNRFGEREVHSFEEYLYFLRLNGTYLGEQELVAYANLVNKPIHVYNPERVMVNHDGKLELNESGLPKLYDICIINPETPTTSSPIYLYHVNGNHYELLTRR